MAMRIIVLFTREAATAARDLQSRLAGRAAVETVTVPESSDLSAAVLRAGKVQPPYDAAVCLGLVEPAIEPFVTQNIANAGAAVSVPVVTKLSAVADMTALADRVIRLASMGLGPGAAVLGVDKGAGIRTFDASSPHPATLRGSGVGGGVPAAGRRTGVGSDGSSTTSSRLGGIVPGLGAGGMAPARDSTLAAYAGLAATARAGHTLSLGMGMGGGRGGGGGGGGGSPGAASSASGSSTYASGYDREPSPAASAPAGGVGFTLGSPGRVRGGGGGGPALGAAGIENADAGTRKLLSVLRDALVKQGGTGIAAIGRRFRIVDDDGSRTFAEGEFVKALRELGLTPSTTDLQRLFTYFDHNSDGLIDYDEFLVGLRGDLNERRAAIVQEAFKVLDRDGSGEVGVEDLVDRYDTSRHPDVISGRAKPDQVLRQFLDGFDGGNHDGRVTAKEFQRYYATISASIDDDDYFELMIRNAWHISGGKGWAANTSNRRVLVTMRDGTQRVEEVPNDLSAGNNPMLIKKALAAKGLDVAAVALFGSDADSGTGTGSAGGGGGGPRLGGMRSRLGASASSPALRVAAPVGPGSPGGGGGGASAVPWGGRRPSLGRDGSFHSGMGSPGGSAGGSAAGAAVGGAASPGGRPLARSGSTGAVTGRYTTTTAGTYKPLDPSALADEPVYGIKTPWGAEGPTHASSMVTHASKKLASYGASAVLPGGPGGSSAGFGAGTTTMSYGQWAPAGSLREMDRGVAAGRASAIGPGAPAPPSPTGLGATGYSPFSSSGKRLAVTSSPERIVDHARSAAGQPTGGWNNAHPAGMPLPAPAAGLDTLATMGRVAGMGLGPADGGYRPGRRPVEHPNKGTYVTIGGGEDDF